MGARLVTQALSPAWGHLSETARLVLVTMCHTAKDYSTDQQVGGRYFAGHDSLVLVLTGRDPGVGDWWKTTEYRTVKRRVARAMRELEAAEAVTLVQRGHRGRNAIYEVTPTLRLCEQAARRTR